MPEEVTALIPGSALHDALGAEDLPAVGDWVALSRDGDGPGIIRGLVGRRTRFVRHVAGRRNTEQVIAANIDRVAIVSSLNEDFNPRRIQRYVTAVYDGGAEPAVILTKSDLCDDASREVAEVEAAAPGVGVIAVSAHLGDNMTGLFDLARPGHTIVFVGSSGVGKSTLVNALAQDAILEVKDIRADGRGRHTTTFRCLIALGNGSVVIDTPGMREFQLWGGDLDVAFQDMADLAALCRFNDCRHEAEPGCAVLAAIESGDLDPSRLESYNKLLREVAFADSKRDRAKRLERRQNTRRRTREYKDTADHQR
jgi:ribosome biogenesis GTPase